MKRLPKRSNFDFILIVIFAIWSLFFFAKGYQDGKLIKPNMVQILIESSILFMIARFWKEKKVEELKLIHPEFDRPQLRKPINNKKTKIFDLPYNNEKMITSYIYVPVMGFIMAYSLLFYALLVGLAEEFNWVSLKPHTEFLGGLFFILALLLMFSRHLLYFSKLKRLHKNFQFDDLIFTTDALKISPFLIEETSLNIAAENKSKVGRFSSYIIIPWNEIISIIVGSGGGINPHATNGRKRHFTYQIKLKGEGSLILHRRPFFGFEKYFLNLICEYSQAKIVLKDKLRENQSEMRSMLDKMTYGIFFILVILFCWQWVKLTLWYFDLKEMNILEVMGL